MSGAGSYCPQCGQERRDEALYCGQCGQALPTKAADKLTPGRMLGSMLASYALVWVLGWSWMAVVEQLHVKDAGPLGAWLLFGVPIVLAALLPAAIAAWGRGALPFLGLLLLNLMASGGGCALNVGMLGCGHW